MATPLYTIPGQIRMLRLWRIIVLLKSPLITKFEVETQASKFAPEWPVISKNLRYLALGPDPSVKHPQNRSEPSLSFTMAMVFFLS